MRIDLIVGGCGVGVEGLCDRAAGDRLDLVGQRGELFIAPPVGVGRVDGDLALKARDLAQSVADLVGGHSHEDGVGSGGIATVPPMLVTRCPAFSSAGRGRRHVSAADNGDVHAGSSRSTFRPEGRKASARVAQMLNTPVRPLIWRVRRTAPDRADDRKRSVLPIKPFGAGDQLLR